MRARTALLVATLLALFDQASAQDSRPASRPIELTGLDTDAPLTITAHFTPELLTLRVRLRDGWHLYGRDTGGGQPAAIEILGGSCFTAAGPLKAPTNQKGEITGDADLTLPLRRVAPGEALRANFEFMACDALQCLPPMTVLLTGAPPQSTLPQSAPAAPTVLLVAAAKDERAARIEQFLTQRGFRPTVTTYAAVQKEQCDAHDVVLADSPYFKQAGAARKDAMRFPETATPMVAVGFLGSQVLVAQKVTMACGYI
jgi:hypothetical protein